MPGAGQTRRRCQRTPEPWRSPAPPRGLRMPQQTKLARSSCGATTTSGPSRPRHPRVSSSSSALEVVWRPHMGVAAARPTFPMRPCPLEGGSRRLRLSRLSPLLRRRQQLKALSLRLPSRQGSQLLLPPLLLPLRPRPRLSLQRLQR